MAKELTKCQACGKNDFTVLSTTAPSKNTFLV